MDFETTEEQPGLIQAAMQGLRACPLRALDERGAEAPFDRRAWRRRETLAPTARLVGRSGELVAPLGLEASRGSGCPAARSRSA